MISIVLPTYNSIEFLEDRLLSILNQSLKDWECIVIDGYSTDGTWEYLTKETINDTRFSYHQFPAKGPYDAWNKGILLARGEYIYIATADDTMDIDFLQIMLEKLKLHPYCKIAHCKLTIIDKRNRKSSDSNWDTYYPSQFYGDFMDECHIRIAPLDGFLHCFLKTVYTSITQLLISREVFDSESLFKTDQGSIADFEWGLKAGLKHNVIHVPLYLATWRNHESQLTTSDIQENYQTYLYLYNVVNSNICYLSKDFSKLDLVKIRLFFLNDALYYYLKNNKRIYFRFLRRILRINKSDNIRNALKMYTKNNFRRLIQQC